MVCVDRDGGAAQEQQRKPARQALAGPADDCADAAQNCGCSLPPSPDAAARCARSCCNSSWTVAVCLSWVRHIEGG